ncbi:MAG: putative deacylase [Gammaproteobacteria bacterium]|jgi:predicted deacylase|tara:strand:- start:1975 stop:3234 length:1260 start_codon:yes stop_codon:yes gene_type:complete
MASIIFAIQGFPYMPFFCRIVFLWTLFLGVSVNNVYATELADDEDIVISEVDEKSIIAEEPVLDMQALETSVEIQAVALQLLGEEVLPGKFMPLNWSPEQSFQSLNTPVPVLVAHGANRGPVMCLTAAIHGDELNGIEMIRRLIYQLDPEKMNGTVIGIPIVNLDGFRRGSRYLADRRDLNRHFPGSPKGSAADRMAYSLFHNVIRHCEYLVDLHTGSLKRTNLPQIRGDLGSETVFDFSRHFGGITVLHGVGAEGTLRRAAENIGIPAITLEAGGPNQLDKSSVDAGLKALETLLQNLGIQPTLRFWGSPQPVFYQSHWIRADQSGILISSVELGDKVKKGDVLGIVTDPMTNTGTKIIATFNGRILGMAFNQVVQTGFAAYHVGVEKEPEAVKEEVLIEGEKIDKPEALLESKIEQE